MLLPYPWADVKHYAWRLTDKDREEVHESVMIQLSDEFVQDVYGVEDDMPINKVKGRDLLTFFESQDAAYWANLLATYPDDARKEFTTFAMLDRRYNP